MIQPPAFEYRCPACGWHRVSAPSSDALDLAHDLVLHCPKCQHEPLEMSVAPAPWREKLGALFEALLPPSKP